MARTLSLLDSSPECIAASSWMKMFGAASALVRPRGGTVSNFLTANSTPATMVFRRCWFDSAQGYNEGMREGFEDWDFALRLLKMGGRIDIVNEPLINYRTAPTSTNISSMGSRARLFGHIIDNHREVYASSFRTALVELEARSHARLILWEQLERERLNSPIVEASYGDGGMASVVRMESFRGQNFPSN